MLSKLDSFCTALFSMPKLPSILDNCTKCIDTSQACVLEIDISVKGLLKSYFSKNKGCAVETSDMLKHDFTLREALLALANGLFITL